MTNTNHTITEKDIQVIGQSDTFTTKITPVSNENGVAIFDVNITAAQATFPQRITLKWKIPAHNVKGVWKPTTDFAKESL